MHKLFVLAILTSSLFSLTAQSRFTAGLSMNGGLNERWDIPTAEEPLPAGPRPATRIRFQQSPYRLAYSLGGWGAYRWHPRFDFQLGLHYCWRSQERRERTLYSTPTAPTQITTYHEVYQQRTLSIPLMCQFHSAPPSAKSRFQLLAGIGYSLHYLLRSKYSLSTSTSGATTSSFTNSASQRVGGSTYPFPRWQGLFRFSLGLQFRRGELRATYELSPSDGASRTYEEDNNAFVQRTLPVLGFLGVEIAYRVF